jgi:hypothetical protein
VRVQGIAVHRGQRQGERAGQPHQYAVWGPHTGQVVDHRGRQRGARTGRGLPTRQVEEDLWVHVDIVQEKQHENELIAPCRGQVDLQHQLLAAQEWCIQQNDVKVAEIAARVGLLGVPGASVSQLPVMGPPAVAAPSLILGRAQPPGYVFVGQHLVVVIWGHPDIVQASITNEGDKK